MPQESIYVSRSGRSLYVYMGPQGVCHHKPSERGSLMKKNLLTLAVTSALAGIATAQADTVNVNVYGKLYPEFAVAGGSGASDPAAPRSTLIRASSGENPQSTQFVNSANSYVGFKGDVDIGGGMKGWFQVEQTTDVDVGVSTWASRNSGVGI